MQTFRIIVKGTRKVAEAELAKRKLKATYKRLGYAIQPMSAVFEIDMKHIDKVVEWYCEDTWQGAEKGYPDGTCLRYYDLPEDASHRSIGIHERKASNVR